MSLSYRHPTVPAPPGFVFANHPDRAEHWGDRILVYVPQRRRFTDSEIERWIATTGAYLPSLAPVWRMSLAQVPADPLEAAIALADLCAYPQDVLPFGTLGQLRDDKTGTNVVTYSELAAMLRELQARRRAERRWYAWVLDVVRALISRPRATT